MKATFFVTEGTQPIGSHHLRVYPVLRAGFNHGNSEFISIGKLENRESFQGLVQQLIPDLKAQKFTCLLREKPGDFFEEIHYVMQCQKYGITLLDWRSLRELVALNGPLVLQPKFDTLKDFMSYLSIPQDCNYITIRSEYERSMMSDCQTIQRLLGHKPGYLLPYLQVYFTYTNCFTDNQYNAEVPLSWLYFLIEYDDRYGLHMPDEALLSLSSAHQWIKKFLKKCQTE
jgi:hypothetical protein